MRTKEQVQAEINKLQEELEELEKVPVWPLPQDTEHWVYFQDGRTQKQDGLLFQRAMNQALSQKRAIQLYGGAKLRQDMYLWIDTFCPDWKPDWQDGGAKYGIYINNGELDIDHYYACNPFIDQVSVPTKELAESMFEIFGDRIKELYL